MEASTCILWSFSLSSIHQIKSIGEIKDHDSQCAFCFDQVTEGLLKQVDDGSKL